MFTVPTETTSRSGNSLNVSIDRDVIEGAAPVIAINSAGVPVIELDPATALVLAADLLDRAIEGLRS